MDAGPHPRLRIIDKDELDLVVDELNNRRDSLQRTFANLRESEAMHRELYYTMSQGVVY